MTFKINEAPTNVVGNTRNLVRCGIAAALSVAALSFAGTGAQAGTATATLGVSITINSFCAFDTTPTDPVAFGTVTTLATVVNATGHLRLNCSPTAGITIGLDPGKHSLLAAGAAYKGRTMTVGGAGAGNPTGNPYVAYQLYQPDATTEWGDLINGGPVYSYLGTGALDVINVFGKTAINNGPLTSGSYSDIVTVTVNF